MAEGSEKNARRAAGDRQWDDHAERVQRQVNDFVHQRPLLALTMALAGGYIAGRILSRV